MTARTLFLSAVFLGLAATGVFEARVVLRQREELAILRKNIGNETRRVAALRGEHDTAQQTLLAAEQQLAALPAARVLDAESAAREAGVQAWLGRVRHLQRLVAERPEQRIPELKLLTDEDWLRVAQRASFDDEHDMRKALGELRTSAKRKFFQQVSKALGNYEKTAGNEAPSSILALASHFDPPIDAAMLERYEIFKGSLSSNRRQVGLVVREKTPIDEDYDSATEASSSGGLTSSGPPFAWPRNSYGSLSRAYRAFAEANQGARATGIKQVLPYINPPLEPSKLEAALRIERERQN